MSNKFRTEIQAVVGVGTVAVLVLFLIAAAVWVPAHFEAKTYTRLTGKPVTTWDAVWLDLRVQEQIK